MSTLAPSTNRPPTTTARRHRGPRILRSAVATALSALALLCAGGPASAGVPQRLTQQGRLFDAQGSPAQGTVSLVLTIYDAPTGGNVLWQETQSVALDDGYLSVQLGDAVPLTASVFDGSTRYFGMKVDDDSELTPRSEIGSVPYA